MRKVERKVTIIVTMSADDASRLVNAIYAVDKAVGVDIDTKIFLRKFAADLDDDIIDEQT